MARLPLLKPETLVQALEKFGWRIAGRGSHIIMVKEGHIATLSIPNQPVISRGALRRLLHHAGFKL
ncbi:MAG: type II toxin-antitoxin system HicA family toxin [Bacillota bacterium]|nr:type II toxin-antitoxin system HicA family toxin [Bacillota bacterium]